MTIRLTNLQETAADAAPMSMAAKPGRNAARTRERILAAAQAVFASRGYAHAGIRDIALAAGVNIALVARYFGPKEKLFEAALDNALTRTDQLWTQPRSRFGDGLVSALFDGEAPAINPLPILMQASSDPGAQAVALDLLRKRVAEPLAVWLGDPNGDVRAAEILALTAGVFLYRIMLPLAPFEGRLHPSARAWLADALQRIVDA